MADLRLPVVQTWAEWSTVFTDVGVWAPAVREICRRAGLPCGSIEAGYPGTNAVFVVNRTAAETDPFIVKIYAPGVRADYQIERELHPLLTKVPELRVPELLGDGVLEEQVTWPYLLLSYLPGRPIREVRKKLSPDEVQSVAEALGRQLHALHAVPTAPLQALDTTRQGWERYVTVQSGRIVDQLRTREVLPQQIIDEIPDFVASTLSQDPRPPLVLVNGDVTEDHLLLEQHDGSWSISGLIDFADSRFAPRTYEWIALWFGALDRNRAAFQALMASYDPKLTLDAAFYEIALAFTFLHEFGGGIIDTALKRMGRPTVRTMANLQQVLWLSDPSNT